MKIKFKIKQQDLPKTRVLSAPPVQSHKKKKGKGSYNRQDFKKFL